MCFPEEHSTSEPILARLFLKLQNLKAMNKVVLVVSDIHCRETSAVPEQYAEKNEEALAVPKWSG